MRVKIELTQKELDEWRWLRMGNTGIPPVDFESSPIITEDELSMLRDDLNDVITDYIWEAEIYVND